MCTQPRRVAAISVAEWVAKERGEPIGTSVGYQVKMDSKLPRHQVPNILSLTQDVYDLLQVQMGYIDCDRALGSDLSCEEFFLHILISYINPINTKKHCQVTIDDPFLNLQ